MAWKLFLRQFSYNLANLTLSQTRGLLPLAHFILITIGILAAKSLGKYTKGNFENEDCLNITFPKWSQPYSFLEPCVKLWTGVNCKGRRMSQISIGIARSFSGCSICKSRNQRGGRLCTGHKRKQKCIKVPSICDGGFETSKSSSEFEISKDSNEFEGQNVHTSIEPLDIKTFKVFDAWSRQQEEGPPVPFIAYRKSDPGQGLDAETVEFQRNEKVLIYIHGYATTMLEDGTNIKDAAFEGTWDVDSVIIVDWRRWALPADDSSRTYPPNYKIVALVNVPIVAQHVRQFLLTHLHNENYIYFVGFSLGGHVSGTAAREAIQDGLYIDRISALDPAGPIFEYTLNGIYPLDTTNTLRVTDAEFVDVIHCSTVLGMVEPAGHLDTYLEENDCWSPSCTHHRAVELYISSLKQCSLITCPMSGEACSPFTVSAFGYLSDLYAGRGKYILSVITHWWSWKDKDCSEFMNVYLPAKHRVCFEPQNDGNGECFGKPYLTECPVNCPNNNQGNFTSKVCSTDLNVRLEYEDSSQNHARSLKVATKTQDQVRWQGGDCV